MRLFFLKKKMTDKTIRYTSDIILLFNSYVHKLMCQLSVALTRNNTRSHSLSVQDLYKQGQ